jgi:hypothetical protein
VRDRPAATVSIVRVDRRHAGLRTNYTGPAVSAPPRPGASTCSSIRSSRATKDYELRSRGTTGGVQRGRSPPLPGAVAVNSGSKSTTGGVQRGRSPPAPVLSVRRSGQSKGRGPGGVPQISFPLWEGRGGESTDNGGTVELHDLFGWIEDPKRACVRPRTRPCRRPLVPQRRTCRRAFPAGLSGLDAKVARSRASAAAQSYAQTSYLVSLCLLSAESTK